MRDPVRRFLCRAAVVAAALAIGPACRREPAPRTNAGARTEYACPMHPTFVADGPGTCAICGMQLTPRASHSRRRAPRSAPAPDAAAAADPASDAPAASEADGDPVGAEVIDAGRTVAGRASVALAPDSRRLLGVRTEPVRRMRLVRQLRTVGRVARGG